MNAHEQKHADAQRWHYEMAIAWRSKYHNRILGNALNIEQAA